MFARAPRALKNWRCVCSALTGGRIDGTAVGFNVYVSVATAWRWWRCCGDAVVEVYSDGAAVGSRYGALHVIVTVAWGMIWGRSRSWYGIRSQLTDRSACAFSYAHSGAPAKSEGAPGVLPQRVAPTQRLFVIVVTMRGTGCRGGVLCVLWQTSGVCNVLGTSWVLGCGSAQE